MSDVGQTPGNIESVGLDLMKQGYEIRVYLFIYFGKCKLFRKQKKETRQKQQTEHKRTKGTQSIH